jgi:hypothetical protein
VRHRLRDGVACGDRPAAKRKATQAELPAHLLARVFLVMTLAATSGSLLFNFSTNGNYELLHERFAAISRDPALLGLLLAAVYAWPRWRSSWSAASSTAST